MDTFEYEEDLQPVQEETQAAYRGTGAGRKESPYANSPYIAQPAQPRQEYEMPQTGGEPLGQTPPRKPAPQKHRKKSRAGNVWRTVAAVTAVLAVAIGSCAVTANVINNRWETRTSEMEQSFSRQIEELKGQIGSDNSAKDEPTGNLVSSVENSGPSQVYAQNVDSVVMVYSTVVYYSYGQQGTGTSTGSGFFISEDGYILTNCHVVEDAQSVKIVTHNGDQYDARIIGSDSTSDVALLKVSGSTFPAVRLGSSDALTVGDQVAAIGNPLGELTATMTVGYISGKERSVTTDGTTINMIQTDAAINSGNSGGPLFNMRGEVVGITSAKYSGESSSGASIEGIGFAIPIDDAMEVVEDLMAYGYVKSAYMGVSVMDMDASVAQAYNLPLGVKVVSVEADGPAQKAGIQTDDIIIGLGDAKVENYSMLGRELRKYEPGDTTTVTVFRGGQTIELTITLAEKPQTTTQDDDNTGSSMPDGYEDWSFEDFYDYFDRYFGNRNNGG